VSPFGKRLVWVHFPIEGGDIGYIERFFVHGLFVVVIETLAPIIRCGHRNNGTSPSLGKAFEATHGILVGGMIKAIGDHLWNTIVVDDSFLFGGMHSVMRVLVEVDTMKGLFESIKLILGY
jgi:hypothetical protein